MVGALHKGLHCRSYQHKIRITYYIFTYLQTGTPTEVAH